MIRNSYLNLVCRHHKIILYIWGQIACDINYHLINLLLIHNSFILHIRSVITCKTVPPFQRTDKFHSLYYVYSYRMMVIIGVQILWPTFPTLSYHQLPTDTPVGYYLVTSSPRSTNIKSICHHTPFLPVTSLHAGWIRVKCHDTDP